MDNPTYVSLNRQSGLLAEMQTIANNIANMSTAGFRKEGVIFAEHVAAAGTGGPSLSMASAEGRIVSLAQGSLTATGGMFDLAIEGDGFFQIETPSGNELTRAGGFTVSPEGELVTADGFRVLDSGAAPIAVPADAGTVAISRDGTISAAGVPVGQVGLFRPSEAGNLEHAGGTRFTSLAGIEPEDGGSIFQGFLESSNVNPVLEITRMIDVQRAYEMGQGLLDREDARIRNVIQTLGR